MKWKTYAHGSENDGKVVVVVVGDSLARQLDETALATDLGGNLRTATGQRAKNAAE